MAKGDALILKFDQGFHGDLSNQHYGFLHQGSFIIVDWPPMKWNHVCLSYQNVSRITKIVSNGKVVFDEVDEDLKSSGAVMPDDFLKNLYIMGRQPGDDPKQYPSLFGKMTDVNIWDRPLGLEEMEAWINCTSGEGGNIVDWDTAEWTLFLSVLNIRDQSWP